MKSKCNIFFSICLIYLYSNICFAIQRATGFGQVAQNMLEPVGLLTDFVSSACLVLGISFLFTAIIKYVEHKRSPLMVPISTVVFLVIGGLLLLLLPFLSFVTENGMHFSLLNRIYEESHWF